MPRAGLEPARLAAWVPKTHVTACYTTSAVALHASIRDPPTSNQGPCLRFGDLCDLNERPATAPTHFPESPHKRAVLSALPVTARRPSAEKTTLKMKLPCPSRRRSSRPLSTSQTRSRLSGPPPLGWSPLPLSKRRPSGAKDTLQTTPGCPWNLRISLPEQASHRRIDASTPPEATRRPSGEKATAVTFSPCPTHLCSSSPLSTSQIRTVPSSLPEAARRPSRDT